MVVNSLNALTNVIGQTWLANLLETLIIRDGSSLMELSEKVIEINDGSGVIHEGIPVVSNFA